MGLLESLLSSDPICPAELLRREFSFSLEGNGRLTIDEEQVSSCILSSAIRKVGYDSFRVRGCGHEDVHGFERVLCSCVADVFDRW